MVTAEQMRAARAMLRIEQGVLAEKAGVSIETVKRFEAMTGEIKGRYETVRAIQSALELEGIEFINVAGEAGVKLVSDPSAAYKRLTAYTAQKCAMLALETVRRKDPDLFKKGPEHVAEVLIEGMPFWLRREMPKAFERREAVQAQPAEIEAERALIEEYNEQMERRDAEKTLEKKPTKKQDF